MDAAPQTMMRLAQTAGLAILYGTDLEASPSASTQGAWAFQLPDQPGAVDYLETPFQTTKTPASITITFEVDSTEAQYNGTVDPLTPIRTLPSLFERRTMAPQQSRISLVVRPERLSLGSNDNHVLTITCPLTTTTGPTCTDSRTQPASRTRSIM